MPIRYAVWSCINCDVGGSDEAGPEEIPTCWNCDRPTTVTARPIFEPTIATLSAPKLPRTRR